MQIFVIEWGHRWPGSDPTMNPTNLTSMSNTFSAATGQRSARPSALEALRARAQKPRHYLDHAATSPLRTEARDAMVEAYSLGNPGGQYDSGRRARQALEDARETVARILGCEPIEVIFTSGGTEADNLGIQGLYLGLGAPGTIALAPIEHDAVLKSAAFCRDRLGATLLDLPVTPEGRVDASALPAITGPAMLTCMWANNETGAIQPIKELTDLGLPTHIDAVQAVGHEDINFHATGAATLALSAHKFGGPRGVGVLLARRDAKVISHVNGGGQERGLRSGTVDVAAAVGLAAALQAATTDMEAENARLARLRDRLWEGIRGEAGDVVKHTSEPALPGHLHISVPGAEGDSLIMLLDAAGIECSTGSACNAGVNRPSHVLLAMGVPEDVARGAVRFSLGHATTEQDVDAVLAVVGDTVARAKAAGMA